MREIEVSKEPLELYKILKFEGVVSSGGEAKSVIAEGQVLVNGKVGNQKAKTNCTPGAGFALSGDIVEFGKNMPVHQNK